MFGGSVMAIKSFTILLSLSFVAFMWYTFRIPLPSFNIRVKDDVDLNPWLRTNVALSRQRTRQEKTENNRWGSLLKDLIGKHIPGAFGSSGQDDPVHRRDKLLLKEIIKSKVQQKVALAEQKSELMKIHFPSDKPTFDATVLNMSPVDWKSVDNSFLLDKAKELQNKLLEFNVPISIDGFDIWPSIVQVRIRPEAGIKVSAIENLKNDIALSLRAKALRIVSPVPWTDCIWIQIPNPHPQMVYLWDCLLSSTFLSLMKKSSTNLALWQAIDGKHIVKSLENMPHLLIAGTTWSGKSVGVNDFVLSLMYQNSPSELKLLMVDPKQVEMELYSWLPYLLAPIITQPEKALRMLKWAVEEMEVRYRLLKINRVKNVEEYNHKYHENSLYRIVIVIDELADLMLSWNKKDIEICIVRIAQKARAVGMHLIVATQRPSVNVITGLIKANMPTRIAFCVVGQVDSRVILGMKGAEELVGNGDFLYSDSSIKFPLRIQAPYVSTQEIDRIVSGLKAKYMQWVSEHDIYHPDVLSALEGQKTFDLDIWLAWMWWSSSDDELVEQAIGVISQTWKASATLFQRKLNVWFARAARIMDVLEQRWIVWPQDGAKARDVLM